MLGVLTVSHGTSDVAGQNAIERLVHFFHGTVAVTHAAHAFVDVQEPDIETALAAFPEGVDVVIVPLLLSRGYHLDSDIQKAARNSGRNVAVANALGPDPRLAQLMAKRLVEAGVRPVDRVVLAAAGSSSSGGVSDSYRAASLLACLLKRPIMTAFLSATQPRLPHAVRFTMGTPGTERVAVATYLLAPGYFSDAARDAGGDIATEPLLLPHTSPDRLIVDVARDRFAVAAERLQKNLAFTAGTCSTQRLRDGDPECVE